MKRLLGLIACTLPLFSVAEFVVPIETVEEYVNIRMVPDQKSEIVGRLFRGDSATLVQSLPEWHEIKIAGGATGYISSEWTNVVDSLPVPEVETIPVAEEITEIVVATQRRVETPIDKSSSPVQNESDSEDEDKKNIIELSSEEALAALANLEPVTFRYTEEDEERHVGFGAENVPNLIASSESEGLKPLEIVAVLTRVVKLQQLQIEELESRLQERD